ncbi:MAG: NAD-dependent epimerase/dehydratase family protein [Gammaproteobacteria bacterium]|nr:NAD-dependent epimerase/dehydratase family protein [Gammaproteobacteria bacterium]
MRIVVTGADGFIGRNLRVRLRERDQHEVMVIVRDTAPGQVAAFLHDAEAVMHLAGVNRAKDEKAFGEGNTEFTRKLCEILASTGRPTPIIYASSAQATVENVYGRSKRAAEELLLRHARDTGSPVHLFRLNNVFGKWSRPNYNSVVATFCYQIARGLPISIHDPNAPLKLVYVDDVVDAFLRVLGTPLVAGGHHEAGPIYDTTVGELASALYSCAASRSAIAVPRVGAGLMRALYATYVSFLEPDSFAYDIPCHSDKRGAFVEMLKTPDCGQISYFTAYPGITRGEHYHHTKTEKFLVVRGAARFTFRNVDTGQRHCLEVRGGEARIVESVPGWAHAVSNIGEEELIVLLWASETFDRARPDTVAVKVLP